MTSQQYNQHLIHQFWSNIIYKRNQITSVLVVFCLVIGSGSQSAFPPMFLAGVLFSFIAITDRAQQSTISDGTKLSISKFEYGFHYLVVLISTIAAISSFCIAFAATVY